MNKLRSITLLLVLILSLSGCQMVFFLTPSPYQELNKTDKVTIALLEDSISDSGLTLLIENHTVNELSCDMFYAIEQERNGKWYGNSDDQSFPSLAMLLPPEQAQEFHVSWENKPRSGKYRVIKSVFVGSRTEYFSVEFEIQ